MTNLSEAAPHRLLGLYDSPFVRRVAVSMHLYGIPFEHVSLSVFRQMDAMRPINPLFKVPMLTLPNGETLYESAYILDYLDELACERGLAALIPRQGAERRQVQQLMALATVATEKAVAIEYEHKRPRELLWAEWTDRLRGQMRQAFAMLEEKLVGDFLFGNRLTQADITTVSGIGFVRYVRPDEWAAVASACPALSALADRLEASAAFQAVPIDQ